MINNKRTKAPEVFFGVVQNLKISALKEAINNLK
jgi:hypothetical protein